MEKYENLGAVGEGSYGMVLKCRHKDTQQVVAIKKFLESDDDRMVKKIAMREVRMLKSLRHENLVNLIEVFRRKKRLYLVFEFVDHTILDELEKSPHGLDEDHVRQIIWQVTKGIEFCHTHNIIHRDIKPENILISNSGVVKLCDFGFARTMAQPGETYTDYVATRWYRAPELLVGDTTYGRPVDVWAIGCLTYELLSGEPLFPGESDIDQLYHIVRCFGNLTQHHREIFNKNPIFMDMKMPEAKAVLEPFEKKCANFKCSTHFVDLMKEMLFLDAADRPSSTETLNYQIFTHDDFVERFPKELKHKIVKENQHKPLNQTRTSQSSAEKKNPHKEPHKEQQIVLRHKSEKLNHLTEKESLSYDSSMPVISTNLPLVNGTQSPASKSSDKTKSKKRCKQKAFQTPLDMGLKAEKTTIHGKYNKQVNGKGSHVHEDVRSGGSNQGIYLPEVKRTDAGSRNKATSTKSYRGNGHPEMSRNNMDSQLSYSSFPSV